MDTLLNHPEMIQILPKHHCLKHNVDWNVSPFNFLQHPNGCKYCQEEILMAYYNTKRKSNEQFIQEVKDLGTGIIPLEEYKGTHEKISFQCKFGHIWSSTPHDILNGYGCPYCAGNHVFKGYNDLWTTNPEMAKMLCNPNVGYEISRGSNQEVEWICPDCGTHKFSSPKQVYDYGLACFKCSSSISYPNRFIVSLLLQLGIHTFKREWSPEWVGRCKYDVYLIYNNIEYIIEMDGGIGHGCIEFGTGNKDVSGLERDAMKNEQAKLHNIEIIRIDCKYQQKHMRYRLDYVKNSILNSRLNDILDLSKVDWNKCNIDSTISLHMIAAQQYDNGLSIKEISKNLNVNYSTIYSWLKRLAKEGLCSYIPKIGAPTHNKNKTRN